MGKGLASYPEKQRLSVATRRLIGNTRGNGFWGAKDYFDKHRLKYPIASEIGKNQRIADALANVQHTTGGFHMNDDNPPRPRKGKLPRRPPVKRNGRRGGTRLAEVWPG